MQRAKRDGNGSLDDLAEHVERDSQETDAIEHDAQDNVGNSDVVATVATVAVVGIGAAALEAALLPGIVPWRRGYVATASTFQRWARR